jgi:hypothetical protein
VDGGATRFPPPRGAVWLYPGKVMHARFKPRAHRFTYRVFCLLIDVGQLDAASTQARLFSVGRFNLLSFQPRDHGTRDGSSLAAHVDRLLEPTGLPSAGRRALLLCYPRLLGYVFNPLSVYFVYGAEGALQAVIYEVRNTFGEMHTYVAPIQPGELDEAGVRQARDKLFYVSPFIDMPMRYHFRLRPPQADVAVRILETDAEGPLLAATFHGRQRDLTSWTVLTSCLALPFMTFKVYAGIHWEALRLWLKGIRLKTYASAPGPVSYRDPAADPGSG